ncbi:MAG: sulfatase [Saprospiraceae bacterium]|nr:sulfatase [Saprospiraceae bacterium]
MTKITLLFLILLSCLGCSEQPAEMERPNVVFMVCDDLNDYIGVFGGHPQARTPHMDALAENGVAFLNAQSNIPVCSPSRNSFLTGVYPHDSEDFAWTPRTEQKMLQHNKTFIDLFKENGYYIAGSGKIYHTHETEPWDDWGAKLTHNYGPFAFDGEDRVAHPDVPLPYREIGPIDGSYGPFLGGDSSSTNEAYIGWMQGWDEEAFRYVSDDDRDLTNDEKHAEFAIQKIEAFEAQAIDQPFFIGLGFVRPHTPLHAPEKYFNMFPLDEIELDKWQQDDDFDTWYADNFNPDMKGLRYYRTLLASYDGDREMALKSFLQAYLACIAFVDDQIGKVVDAIRSSRYADNTIIILTSDHGWQMGEKSYLFKNSAWEESCRVPLIISGAGTQTGKVAQPVSLIDLFPTLVDYGQLKGPNTINDQGGELGGYSLRPLLEDPDNGQWPGPAGALSIIGNYASVQDSTPAGQNFSYRTIDWRYIRYHDKREELYDHRVDPYEWNNLASDTLHQDILTQLRAEVDALAFGE